MTQRVQLRRSDLPGEVPETLLAGEIALNLVDRRLFFGTNDGSVLDLFGNLPDNMAFGGDVHVAGSLTTGTGNFTTVRTVDLAVSGGMLSDLDMRGYRILNATADPEAPTQDIVCHSLTALGNIAAGGAVAASGAIYAHNDPQFGLFQIGSNRYRSWMANWVDSCDTTNGRRDWQVSGGSMYLTGTGDLYVPGSFTAAGSATITGGLTANRVTSAGVVTAGGFSTTGNLTANSVTVNGNISLGVVTTNDGGLTIGTSGYQLYHDVAGHQQILAWAPNGWYDAFDTSTGMRSWNHPGQRLMTLDGGTAVLTAGNVFADQITQFGAWGGAIASRCSGGTAGFTYNAGLGLHWGTVSSDGSLQTIWGHFEANGAIVIKGQAWKPGGGPWEVASDARTKTVIGNYTHGLAEILQLQPVTYTYLGNDTPELPDADELAAGAPYPSSGHSMVAATGRAFVGLVAQDCAAALPEMVSTYAGYIDGAAVADLHALDTTALIYAVVNAVKTLDTRLTALGG